MGKKNFKPFTEEQLIVIKENSGKINQAELAEKLGINYTNLSTMLNQFRVPFSSVKKPRPKSKTPIVKMEKNKNEKGEEILTDEMMRKLYAF